MGSSAIYEKFALADPDAMLAGTGSTHRNGTFGHPKMQRLSYGDFRTVRRIKQDEGMKIAIANMTSNRRC